MFLDLVGLIIFEDHSEYHLIVKKGNWSWILFLFLFILFVRYESFPLSFLHAQKNQALHFSLVIFLKYKVFHYIHDFCFLFFPSFYLFPYFFHFIFFFFLTASCLDNLMALVRQELTNSHSVFLNFFFIQGRWGNFSMFFSFR